MIKKISFFKNKLNIFFFIFLLIPNFNNAKETLIYADNIDYDKNENIIARGNAKIFYDNEFIFSELIIYEKKTEKIILPTYFTLRDEKNNYYYGDKGFFYKNSNFGEIENIKIQLNDGSRIVGKKGKRDNQIDIITKGVYTPCQSRIKVANFICPMWQLEGEKILHDNENLFLYHKHSKMRVINTPVYYLPYIVTPSPLRKTRKSGFLTPSIDFFFFDTKISQSTSFPYYFNISQDKELTFTPIINYGGGVDSSQRFMFDYNQIISGGNLNFDLTFDSNFERENNNKWFSDASLITRYNKKLNDKFKINIKSALETSKNYIQITNPNDELSYKSSLSTKVNLEGFYLNNIDDRLLVNLSLYQTNQKNENNKTTPTVLPNIEYYSGSSIRGSTNFSSKYNFYNIFRDKNTSIHAKNQQKLSNTFFTDREFIKFKSKFKLQSETHTQFYDTEAKLLHGTEYHTGSYGRIFPIIGMGFKTPFKLNKNLFDFTYEPHSAFVVAPGISNSNKISNEDSSNNTFSLENFPSLNRYAGTDKLDNSKRINFGFRTYNEIFKVNLSQNYEFTDNSNFHIEQGNDDKLSDLLGALEYSDKVSENHNLKINYNFRFDVNEDYLKRQSVEMNSVNNIGTISLSYLDSKSKTNEIIKTDTETLNYGYASEKFMKFSKIKFKGLYDLKKEINTEYSIGYSYFDECFGINIDFARKSYEEDNLKPQDILTLMFSFKNVGSYKSTNLAVSETDKQDIKWLDSELNNNLFENVEN